MEATTISVDMRGIYSLYLFTALFSALLCTWGCSREELSSDESDEARLEMALPAQMRTKAHFEDKNGTATFVWDVDGSMIAVLSKYDDGSKNRTIAQWEGGSRYSPMNITLLDHENSHKALRAASKFTLATNAANVGDLLFCLSPVNGSDLCNVVESAENVEVTFSMPSQFEQSGSGRLEEFRDYTFIKGESTILSTPNGSVKNFAANSTTFRAIPATFRFKITNNMQSDVTMESVKISCSNSFPDKLCWRTDGSTVTISEPEDKSGYFKIIRTLINDGYGEVIPAKSGEVATTVSYYAMCLPFSSAASMANGTLAFILETKEKIHTFNVTTAEFFRNSANKLFESNKIYTFNFLMNENSVELEGVTISDWKGDGFYLPSEEVTANVELHTTYWVQDRENLFTYAFLRMIGDENNYTMWSECNIGEYDKSSSDILFNWSQIAPSSNADTDYLAKYFNNITDFKWQTPTVADFEALFSNANCIVEAAKDEDSGICGLRVKRKDNHDISLFLPISGKKGEHTEYPDSGETIITHTYHGRYWTRDEKDNANAYYVHFEITEVETVVNEVSTFAPPAIVYFNGKKYEVRDTEKSATFTTKAILKK